MRLSSRELIELYPPPRQQAGQQEMMGQQQMQGPRTVILELQQARLLRSVYSQRQLYEDNGGFLEQSLQRFSAKGADRWLLTLTTGTRFDPMLGSIQRSFARDRAKSSDALLSRQLAQRQSQRRRAREWAPNNPRRGSMRIMRRELMELHTLAWMAVTRRRDVREVARCLTDRQYGNRGRR